MIELRRIEEFIGLTANERTPVNALPGIAALWRFRFEEWGGRYPQRPYREVRLARARP